MCLPPSQVRAEWPTSHIVWRTAPQTRTELETGKPGAWHKEWAFKMHISQINAAARHVARYHSVLVDVKSFFRGLGASFVLSQRRAPINPDTTALPSCSRHHNIPLIDVEAMGSGMTPAQSDFDIHHPRDFYAMVSGGDVVPKLEPRTEDGGQL